MWSALSAAKVVSSALMAAESPGSAVGAASYTDTSATFTSGSNTTPRRITANFTQTTAATTVPKTISGDTARWAPGSTRKPKWFPV